MIFKEKIISLKNGKECILKSPTEDDALDIINHIKQTSAETNNMLRYDSEVTITENDERKFLKSIIESKNAIMISAIVDGKIVGNAGLSPVAPFKKCKHRCEFGISIKKDYWDCGIGSILIDEIINSASMAQYEQIELTVVAENQRAKLLYEKKGFQEFGKLKNFFKYTNGTYSDGIYMVKQL